ncbi:hypothetical protein HRW14_00630 [Streptomyces lunaelactis]|uniref:hypothetical protein n=1 Tax=Streptomyces lunaelactis TaxID=1535768 RepID=UPI001585A14B|nr:hypothetical protein [Streptomyces lunaelactis]NUK48836.1 hypothetical protein [Streptomyces lunaelactis]NUK64990.1 hypothetical protein [Streptomyces lunaelactis]
MDSGPAGRKDREGNEVFWFDVQRDTQVMLELPVTMSAGQLDRRLKRRRTSESRPGDRMETGGLAEVMAQARGGGKGLRNPLGSAFLLGVTIGTWIDEQTGASDTLSDWMVEASNAIGEWWENL